MSINTGAAPSYTLDVGGSANVSGKYFVGGAVQPVTYSLPNTEGTAQYIFLGTWYPSGQTGKRLTITMGCGSGYNSANSQLSKVELIVTTANGTNPQTGTGGGSFYGAAVAINSTGLGSAASPSTFRIVQGTTTQFLIYANCLSFTGGSFYTVSLASGDSWTNSSTLYGATGPTSSTYLDVTPSFSILSTAGNVGIGTTSPVFTLDVVGNARSSNHMVVTSAYAQNALSRIILGPAGQTANLDYCSLIQSRCTPDNNYASYLSFWTHSSATTGGDPTNRMEIDSSGTIYFTNYTAGTLSITGSSGQVSSSSDRRLKSNIEYVQDNATSVIMALKPARYTWLSDPSNVQIGFIAQDVETVIPEAVDGKKYDYQWKKDIEGKPVVDENGQLVLTDEPRYRGLSDRPVIAMLVKAFQEMSARLSNVEAKLAATTGS